MNANVNQRPTARLIKAGKPTSPAGNPGLTQPGCFPIIDFSIIACLLASSAINARSTCVLFGEATVRDISDECGFENIESFYRAFKKITNIPPAQYRLKHSARFWNG
jgi:AraC-like DNA-binding protein